MSSVVVRALLVAVATGCATPVYAESAENALRHAGEVMALEKLCSRLIVNQTALAFMLVGNGADLQRPDHKAIALEQARSDIRAWSGKDGDAACVAGMLLYGPNGSSVPGIVKLRR